MVVKKFPTPPASDNPIHILKAFSLREELDFINEFLSAQQAGRVDDAANCALKALPSLVDKTLIDSLVGAVSNLSIKEGSYSAAATQLLCKAVDLGLYKYAYNVANALCVSAKNTEDYRKAEAYFKIAMSFDGDTALQAAAHVNYCPIVRDGLITGSPDWPKAVEIYEEAGKMGLLKGMFNAGNVSAWIANSGDTYYGAKAAYWFKYALDYYDSGKPLLDRDSQDVVNEVLELCMLELSACHIDSKFEAANLDEGIEWAEKVARTGNPSGIHNLEVGYRNRLMSLPFKPGKSPGYNWLSVLSAIGWRISPDISKETVKACTAKGQVLAQFDFDVLRVSLEDGSQIPLFVAHEALLPFHDGFQVSAYLAGELSKKVHGNFLFLNRKAIFRMAGDLSFTPIFARVKEDFSIQMLWLGCSPDSVLKAAVSKENPFDVRFGMKHCAISIVLNTLDEGFSVPKDARFDLPYVPVGDGWCMPFIAEENLKEFKIMLNHR